jgi:hypothetical protein
MYGKTGTFVEANRWVALLLKNHVDCNQRVRTTVRPYRINIIVIHEGEPPVRPYKRSRTSIQNSL